MTDFGAGVSLGILGMLFIIWLVKDVAPEVIKTFREED